MIICKKSTNLGSTVKRMRKTKSMSRVEVLECLKHRVIVDFVLIEWSCNSNYSKKSIFVRGINLSQNRHFCILIASIQVPFLYKEARY